MPRLDLSDAEYNAAIEEFVQIEKLADQGTLGEKTYKNSSHWCWPVLRPEDLPDWLRSNYINYGEIRWYNE